ncbi:MAG: nucleotidyltransferase [Bacteroidetes bacterium]|nr:nucleotidyltransferase [Bacteroidota bacterium]
MMDLDLFKNYALQREELLARIAQSLQLDESRKERMESAYRSVSTVIDSDQGFFKDIDVDVYPQGSVASGTTTKPLTGSEFDLDIVVHIKSVYSKYTPNQIYNELIKVLEIDDRYKDKIVKKKRCVRLKYANDFHMDIMPGCIKLVVGDNNIKVPDRELKNWVDSNPKGFVDWFLSKAKTLNKLSLLEEYRRYLVNLKAEVQDLPNDDFYKKTPLQRAVQLIKRYRDIYFEKDDTYATTSIVLTTLMGQFYAGENTIYYTLENIVTKITSGYQSALMSGTRFKVFNPTNPNEDFTDKWTDKHYENFYSFIMDFHKRWDSIKNSFETGGNDYIRLFGEGVYKQSLQEQVTKMSKYSSDPISKANNLIITGKAYTDSKGNINTDSGYRNDTHRNFGE